MAENEDRRDDDTARLELPSLVLPRFGRRRKRGHAEAEQSVRTEVEAPVGTTAPHEAPTPAQAAAPADVAPAAESPARVASPAASVLPAQQAPSQVEPPTEAGTTASGGRFTTPRMPPLTARVAVLVTGVLVGIAGAALTFASVRTCAAVRGTETCGAVGLPLLVVIVALLILLGTTLLTAWAVAEPRSTSVLAVGSLAVLVLLFSMGESLSPWMFLVVPVLAALCHLLAHWVGTALVETPPDRGPSVDVR